MSVVSFCDGLANLLRFSAFGNIDKSGRMQSVPLPFILPINLEIAQQKC